MKYNAIVGFSVNAELELAVKNTPGPKKALDHMGLCLSGSSGNVTMALKKLGNHPHLLGLVAVRGGEMADRLLDEAVAQSDVTFTPVRVLAHTNICVIPVVGKANGEAWGKRNQVVHSVVPRALQNLPRPEIGVGPGPQTFTVITGLRAVETVFAKTLLARTQPGYRVLNAKDTCCAGRELKKILPLVDLLVLNWREFKETGMEFSELHSRGPRIIVVTDGERGGLFHFHSGQSVYLFNPVSFPGGRFETGAGDWFLGALVSELIRIRKSVFTVNPMQFQEVVNFATKVAGKKITIPGGGNGPTRSQLRR